jgi:hypothetical protein
VEACADVDASALAAGAEGTREGIAAGMIEGAASMRMVRVLVAVLPQVSVVT